MNPVYLRNTDVPVVPYGGEWVSGAAIKKGEFRSRLGLLYMAKLAHTASASTMPDGDPNVIYAKVWKGAYSDATTYEKYDAVSYSGHAFYSLIENNLGHTPSSSGASTAYWGCYAQRGAQGLPGTPGTPGAPGGDANHWMTQETPTGTMDGVNKSFTLSETPTGMVEVWWGSGLGLAYMLYGIDYTYSGTALTLVTFAPNAANGDYLKVRYPYA